MKARIFTLTTVVFVLGGVSLLAAASPRTIKAPAIAPSSGHVETIRFSDTKEADMMHRAYRILATGDHDYHGHRVAAMKQVHKAADKLGLDLTGDDKDKEKQYLSDDRLREARGLLQDILGASEVKDQKHVARHLEAAIKEINTALKVH